MSIKRLNNIIRPFGNPRAAEARGLLYLCIILLTSFFICSAQQKQASLITAWPGSEIYELCGHEAIRIQGDGIDSVWNFGVFNFNEPNFVYRFVKGETDYMVDSYPFAWFMPEYIRNGRRIEEQVLNLTPEEVEKLHLLLKESATPPNNRYRYNYIKNNCSTKVADLLDSIGNGNVIYADTVKFSTYRDAMRAYHANYPWYQFGIDIALGNGLEEELSQREELFIPVELHRHAAKAKLPDGRPLVATTNVLYEGRSDSTDGPTPFLLTPLWFSIVVAAITVLLIILNWRKNCIPKWWYAIYFAVAGCAGCLVTFLVFLSSHAATSPNLLIFWLNPLQLFIPLLIWWNRTSYVKAVLDALMWLNLAVVGMLIVLMPIVDKGQAGQTSFIILMATDVVLAAYYLWSEHKSRHSASSGKGDKRKVKNNKNNKKAPAKARKKSDPRLIIRETTK